MHNSVAIARIADIADMMWPNHDGPEAGDRKSCGHYEVIVPPLARLRDIRTSVVINVAMMMSVE